LRKATAKEKTFILHWAKQTARYLIVFFVRKKTRQALPISARDMTRAERRRYEEK
jgi:uncharacterized DUF497 family protein